MLCLPERDGRHTDEQPCRRRGRSDRRCTSKYRLVIARTTDVPIGFSVPAINVVYFFFFFIYMYIYTHTLHVYIVVRVSRYSGVPMNNSKPFEFPTRVVCGGGEETALNGDQSKDTTDSHQGGGGGGGWFRRIDSGAVHRGIENAGSYYNFMTTNTRRRSYITTHEQQAIKPKPLLRYCIKAASVWIGPKGVLEGNARGHTLSTEK